MTKKLQVIDKLNLREISAVTIPAQSHALATIMKSEDAPVVEDITKYLSTEDGAHSFNEFLASDSEMRRKCKAREHVWPALCALQESVNSIAADTSLGGEDKFARISESAAQFVTTMQSNISDIQTELTKLFTETIGKKETSMSDENVTKIAELEAQITALTKSAEDNAVIAKMSDKEKDHLASLKDEDKESFKKMSSEDRAKAIDLVKAADEVISFEGQEIRKSNTDAASFAVIKSLIAKAAKDEAIAKAAKEAAETVELTKRAETDLTNLPGTAVEKVALLKALSGASAEVVKTFDAIVKAANDGLAPAFQTIGKQAGPQEIAKADKLKRLVKEYAELHKCSEAVAQTAVLTANPGLYEG